MLAQLFRARWAATATATDAAAPAHTASDSLLSQVVAELLQAAGLEREAGESVCR